MKFSSVKLFFVKNVNKWLYPISDLHLFDHFFTFKLLTVFNNWDNKLLHVIITTWIIVDKKVIKSN